MNESVLSVEEAVHFDELKKGFDFYGRETNDRSYTLPLRLSMSYQGR